MNNIYIIYFGMGQKAIIAYECPLPVITNYIYIVHGIVIHILQLILLQRYLYNNEVFFIMKETRTKKKIK